MIGGGVNWSGGPTRVEKCLHINHTSSPPRAVFSSPSPLLSSPPLPLCLPSSPSCVNGLQTGESCWLSRTEDKKSDGGRGIRETEGKGRSQGGGRKGEPTETSINSCPLLHKKYSHLPTLAHTHTHFQWRKGRTDENEWWGVRLTFLQGILMMPL